VSVAPGLNYSTTAADGSRETGTNNGDGTFTVAHYAPDGALLSTEVLEGLPVEPDHVPLDPHGQLVTLLVVVGALTLDDAEHVAGDGVTSSDLVAEAEAWSLGS